VRDGFTRPRPTDDLRSNAAPFTPSRYLVTARIRCEKGRSRRPSHTRGCPGHDCLWHAPHGLPRPVAALTVPSGEHSRRTHCIQGPPRPVAATDQRRRARAVTLSAPPPHLLHDSFVHPLLACFSFPLLHPRWLLRPPRPPFLPFFFGRTLEDRGPPTRRRVGARPLQTAPTGERVSVKPRAVPLLLGPPAGILEWPPRRVGGLHCALSLVTPPAGACVRASPIAYSGERGWLVQRGVSLFLRPTAGIYESPAHLVSRLDISIELVTPPVGACQTRPYCPREWLRATCTAGCVPFSGADRWLLLVAGTLGGPASRVVPSSSPRRWVRAELVHTSQEGRCALLSPRAVSLCWGQLLVFLSWPPHRVGGPHCGGSTVTPKVGTRQSAAEPPKELIVLWWRGGLCPLFSTNHRCFY